MFEMPSWWFPPSDHAISLPVLMLAAVGSFVLAVALGRITWALLWPARARETRSIRLGFAAVMGTIALKSLIAFIAVRWPTYPMRFAHTVATLAAAGTAAYLAWRVEHLVAVLEVVAQAERAEQRLRARLEGADEDES